MATELISGHTSIRNIKRGDVRGRLADGNGLYLLLFVKVGNDEWRRKSPLPFGLGPTQSPTGS